MRTPDLQTLSAFQGRVGEFLRYVTEHTDSPMTTTWGAYRHFDVYSLAALAFGATAS